MDILLQRDIVSFGFGAREQDDFNSSGVANIVSLIRHKNRWYS